MSTGRRRSSAILGLLSTAALATVVVALVGTVMAILGSEIACVGGGGSAVAAPPTRAAVKEIPPERLRIYQEAGKRFDVDWDTYCFVASLNPRRSAAPLP